MTDNVKHSTSYFHEVLAKAFEMFKNGYGPVMETPFQPRRQGSAFVVEYKLVREPLDDLTQQLIDHHDLLGKPGAKFSGEVVELKDKSGKVIRVPGIVVPDEITGYMEFEELLEQSKPIPKDLLQRMSVLKEKAESNRAMEELSEQAQELDMGYDKQLTIQEKWEIDDQTNSEADEQKKLAESEDCGRMVYTKQELDAMEWQEFKKLIDDAGIRGRRRQNLTRDYLKYQEEEK